MKIGIFKIKQTLFQKERKKKHIYVSSFFSFSFSMSYKKELS